MKFEEIADLTIDATKNYLIYFLIKNDDVVYVGQTTQNLLRPFSHKDKDFDTVKILYQSQDKKALNKIEEFFIKKYNPKYNRVFNADKYCRDLMTELYEVEKIKELSKYFMTRKQVNEMLRDNNLKPLSRIAFKKLNYYFETSGNKILLDPESCMKLIKMRIKGLKPNSFSEKINLLLKNFDK